MIARILLVAFLLLIAYSLRAGGQDDPKPKLWTPEVTKEKAAKHRGKPGTVFVGTVAARGELLAVFIHRPAKTDTDGKPLPAKYGVSYRTNPAPYFAFAEQEGVKNVPTEGGYHWSGTFKRDDVTHYFDVNVLNSPARFWLKVWTAEDRIVYQRGEESNPVLLDLQ